MRIAQVAPLYESVPPPSYGGTERIVSYLTEELVRQGHEVTLFASGDSKTKAKLIAPCEKSLRSVKADDPLAHHMVELKMVQDHILDFDIIHYHIDYLHYPFSRFSKTPHVTTMHWRLDQPDLERLYQVFSDIPVISISDAQRKPQPHINWISTVYHGFPQNNFPYVPEKGDYLAFMSRLAPVKRVDRAIKIAKKTGIKLKIAGNINPEDETYFNNHVAWQLDDPLVEYVGSVGDEQKAEFLGNALCMLFPIDWPEPFGMVMAEAMACGTPVIAFNKGSVEELIKPGINGFVVNTIEEAVDAVHKLDQINRSACRNYFEENFQVTHMANQYVKAYEQVIERWAEKEYSQIN
ncbi:MAG: glycosyltransferase family 4 protein [Balneolales bacterium]